MYWLRIRWLFTAVVAFCASVASAGDTNSEVKVIDVQGQLILSSMPDDSLALKLLGPIVPRSTTNFLDITRNRNIDLIILDSPGGDLDAGIAIAEFVALRGINTWVRKDTSCASACSLIFFAGKERVLDGRVGVHQYQTMAGEVDDESAAQERIGRLMELLNAFETPPIVLEKLAITKPTCIYWFGPQHAAMVQRNTVSTSPRIDGALECYDAQKVSPTTTPAAVPVPEVPTGQEIREAVQRQLNRLGCDLGTPDGLIGSRSRAALKSFSKEWGIPYNEANFDDPAFLAQTRTIKARVCAKPPALPKGVAPNLAGNWSLNAHCTYTNVAIRGALTARRTSANRYSLLYRNNVDETASGTMVQNGKRASVTVRWNNGRSTTSHMTLNNAGTRMSGQSDNGCVFTVWR